MTHQDIIDREIVEQYVLHKLSSDDRRGFQEHLFECDACFAEAQRLSGTLARVRHAGARGALDPVAARSAFSWLPPMFAFSIAACFLLAVVAVALFIVNGRLRAEVAAEQEARRSQNQAQSEFETARREAEQKLRASETDRDNLQQQLDEIKGNKPSRPEDLIAQANVPSVVLESTRDANSAAQLTIAGNTRQARLLIPVEIGDRFKSFAVEIQTKAGAPVAAMAGLRPGRSDRLSIALPGARLDNGDYRVRLYGKTATDRELLAEYDLHVVKK